MELNILLILELSTRTKLHLWSIKRPWRMDSPVSSEHQERKKKTRLVSRNYFPCFTLIEI